MLLFHQFIARRFLCPTRRAFSSKTDHFQLLGMTRSFDINPDLLKDTYKEFMKRLHPDLNTMKSKNEKMSIADHASQVTAAYQVLMVCQVSYSSTMTSLSAHIQQTVSPNLVIFLCFFLLLWRNHS